MYIINICNDFLSYQQVLQFHLANLIKLQCYPIQISPMKHTWVKIVRLFQCHYLCGIKVCLNALFSF